MAKTTRKLDISLKDGEWTQHKKLIGKSNCKCYADPSEIFLLGLNTACNAHNVK